MAAAAQPTTEQLELALRHLWRPGYPRTLAEALAHPTFGTCVKGLARNLSRAAPAPRQLHRLPNAPVPPTPTEEPHAARGRAVGSRASGNSQAPLSSWKRTADPGWIDRKRAAANDYDD